MKKILKWVAISFVGLMILGLIFGNDQEPDVTANLPDYKILEDEVKGTAKRTVEVELSSRTDENTLKELAEEIHDLSNKNVERTFIGYRIAGEDDNQGYWATTHYNPELEVKIIGMNDSDYAAVKDSDTKLEGEVLGSWIISRGIEYKTTAYKRDGQVYLFNEHDDGSSGEQAYDATETDKGLKLQDESGKDFGEYMIINNDGELEFWSNNGNYYTAKPL